MPGAGAKMTAPTHAGDSARTPESKPRPARWRVIARCDAFFYPPVPAERLAILRGLVGTYALLYLLIRGLSLTSVVRFAAQDFAPVGLPSLLQQPLATPLVYAAWLIAVLSGAGFVAGYRYRVCAPVFALSFLWVTSYRSSWGMLFHTENLTAIHLLLLSLAPAADVLSVDARRAATPASARLASGRYGWAVQAVSMVTVVTYVLAGVAKLKLAGHAWVDGELLRTQVAYDNLRKIELGSLHSPLGAYLVRFAAPFRALAWASLVLELGAPMALLHMRMARLWVVGVWGFHVGVVALMAIAFPYPLSVIAYASLFPLERLAPRLRRLAQRGPRRPGA
jgi:hypothetical protein